MKKLIYIIIPMLVLVIGCVSPRGEIEKSDDSMADSLQFVQELEILLPSPTEILSVVHDVDLQFDQQIVNPIKNPSDFLLYKNQALNFGVYLTDFSYLILFDIQAEAIKYLYLIQEMANLLGVENYFDDEFFNKLLSNLNQPDTLRSISIEQSAAFFRRMEKIGNKDMVLLITSGSIIETMYIALNVIDERKISDKAIKTIIDLAYIFDSFYLHFQLSQPDVSLYPELNKDLYELRQIFNSMAINQVSNAIRREGKLVFTSEVTHKVNEFNVQKMKVLVNMIRKNIVSQNY